MRTASMRYKSHNSHCSAIGGAILKEEKKTSFSWLSSQHIRDPSEGTEHATVCLANPGGGGALRYCAKCENQRLAQLFKQVAWKHCRCV